MKMSQKFKFAKLRTRRVVFSSLKYCLRIFYKSEIKQEAINHFLFFAPIRHVVSQICHFKNIFCLLTASCFLLLAFDMK